MTEADACTAPPSVPTAGEATVPNPVDSPGGWQRLARIGVLTTVFVCAACGLVYELALVALGSYLIGDTIGQASIVLSIMVFAMGLGALLAKPLQRWPVPAFAAVEVLLGLLGGLSVLTLYAAFAWLDLYTPMLIAVALVIGLLIGAEIPLLMVLLQRIRRQDAGQAVSDLNAADYIGALIGGLAFPFLLLPLLGQIQGAILVGAVNALAGLGLVLVVFRRTLRRRTTAILTAAAVVVTGTLGATWLLADRFEVTARQALYAAPIVYTEQTEYQEIVLTEERPLFGGLDLRMYLNGDLQFSSVDEYRYHEALIHPAMADDTRSVLILGGGDGMGLREALRYPGIERITLVDLDPAVVELASSDDRLVELNGDAFDDPRVEVVNDDAFAWLRDNSVQYDAVIADLPDPDANATAKLYSVEFYSIIKHALAEDGLLAVQASSPYFAQRSYWCVEATLGEAGFATTPYHVDVPSFGDWGFHLAAVGQDSPTPKLAIDSAELRFLNPDVLAAAAVFPADRGRTRVEASTLMHPRILEYAKDEWQNY